MEYLVLSTTFTEGNTFFYWESYEQAGIDEKLNEQDPQILGGRAVSELLVGPNYDNLKELLEEEGSLQKILFKRYKQLLSIRINGLHDIFLKSVEFIIRL